MKQLILTAIVATLLAGCDSFKVGSCVVLPDGRHAEYVLQSEGRHVYRDDEGVEWILPAHETLTQCN